MKLIFPIFQQQKWKLLDKLFIRIVRIPISFLIFTFSLKGRERRISRERCISYKHCRHPSLHTPGKPSTQTRRWSLFRKSKFRPNKTMNIYIYIVMHFPVSGSWHLVPRCHPVLPCSRSSSFPRREHPRIVQQNTSTSAVVPRRQRHLTWIERPCDENACQRSQQKNHFARNQGRFISNSRFWIPTTLR